MPTLKSHRGTVLYAVAGVIASDGSTTEESIPVVNLASGGIQSDRFLREDDTFVNLDVIVPALAGTTIGYVRLSIVYPDGTVATIPQIDFGEVVLVAWSELQLLAVDPTPDADWRQNRTYLRIHSIG